MEFLCLKLILPVNINFDKQESCSASDIQVNIIDYCTQFNEISLIRISRASALWVKKVV